MSEKTDEELRNFLERLDGIQRKYCIAPKEMDVIERELLKIHLETKLSLFQAIQLFETLLNSKILKIH